MSRPTIQVPGSQILTNQETDNPMTRDHEKPPVEAWKPDREAVARIIDPEAWEEYLLEDGRVDEEVASIFQDSYETSLAKADLVLALPSQPVVGSILARPEDHDPTVSGEGT